MDKFLGTKTIKDLGLLDTLEGEEKLYIEGEDFEQEEVNIPLEYFTESELLDTALKNLIRRYGKDTYMASKPIESLGFRVSEDDSGKKYLEFEYIEKCERVEGESDIEYQERLRDFEKKIAKEIIKPYKVLITESFISEKGLKIKAKNFIGEIDRLLDEKLSKESEKINIELREHRITRKEWLEKMEALRENMPGSALEYIKEKMIEFGEYYKYITSFDEYKDMFKEEVMVATIAQEAGSSRSKRFPTDRGNMDHDTVPFEEREQFIKKFPVEKVIRIFDEEKSSEIAYKGYVIDNGKEEGKIIVLEPIDGDKTTFITFESDEEIQKLRVALGAEQGIKVPKLDVYRHTMSSILKMGWSEKVRDEKIINKYHVESYERDMEFIITGELEKGSKVQHSVRSKRAAMIK